MCQLTHMLPAHSHFQFVHSGSNQAVGDPAKEDRLEFLPFTQVIVVAAWPAPGQLVEAMRYGTTRVGRSLTKVPEARYYPTPTPSPPSWSSGFANGFVLPSRIPQTSAAASSAASGVGGYRPACWNPSTSLCA